MLLLLLQMQQFLPSCLRCWCKGAVKWTDVDCQSLATFYTKILFSFSELIGQKSVTAAAGKFDAKKEIKKVGDAKKKEEIRAKELLVASRCWPALQLLKSATP